MGNYHLCLGGGFDSIPKGISDIRNTNVQSVNGSDGKNQMECR